MTVTLAACLLFGLAPAVLATRPSAGTLLRATSRTSTASRASRGARGSLVVAQVALSVVLVVTAVLFARTLRNLSTLDIGFEHHRMTTVVVDYQRAKTPAASRLALQERLMNACGPFQASSRSRRFAWCRSAGRRGRDTLPSTAFGVRPRRTSTS